MGDIVESTSALIVRDELEGLRAKIAIRDTVSKTRKWIQAQIQERVASIESFKGQILNLEGMIEVKTEELSELQRRLAALEQVKE